eukprot:3309019-Rhodomonas_salina.1
MLRSRSQRISSQAGMSQRGGCIGGKKEGGLKRQNEQDVVDGGRGGGREEEGRGGQEDPADGLVERQGETKGGGRGKEEKEEGKGRGGGKRGPCRWPGGGRSGPPAARVLLAWPPPAPDRQHVQRQGSGHDDCKVRFDALSATPPKSNTRKHNLFVQFVPGMRLVVFGFGVYEEGGARCWGIQYRRAQSSPSQGRPGDVTQRREGM